VQLVLAFLLLLDLDGPEALDALCLVGAWRVIVPLMRINFADAEGKEG